MGQDGLGQVGLQIKWDRMALGQGGLPAEPVRLSQSGSTRPWKVPPREGVRQVFLTIRYIRRVDVLPRVVLPFQGGRQSKDCRVSSTDKQTKGHHTTQRQQICHLDHISHCTLTLHTLPFDIMLFYLYTHHVLDCAGYLARA